MRVAPVFLAVTASADDLFGYYSRTIFADDFSSNGFGKRWGHYKSGSVVRDGVLPGITPEKSDHSAVDNIRFPGERDPRVSVKFRFVSTGAKGSHAGHICNVSISPSAFTMGDAKTGNFHYDDFSIKGAGKVAVER